MSVKEIERNEKRFAELMQTLPQPTQKINHFKWGKKLLDKTHFTMFERFIEDYCDLWIWEKSDVTIVLFTQNDANPSCSITNASEYIATAVFDLLPPGKTVRWFESYECYLIENEHYFSEVTYSVNSKLVFGNPRWKYHNFVDFQSIILL